jgi:hypothetical protein
MDDHYDSAVIALVLVLMICLTVFIFRVGAPSGELVALLFPRI